MSDPTDQPDSTSSNPGNLSNPSLRERLQSAIVGLQWISESDFPFEVVQWQTEAAEVTPELLLKLVKCNPETPLQTEEIDRFFEWATQGQDWHTAAEQANVVRYQNLLNLLKQLQNPQVYRLGEVNVDIYILGKLDRDLLGVKTQAVET